MEITGCLRLHDPAPLNKTLSLYFNEIEYELNCILSVLKRRVVADQLPTAAVLPETSSPATGPAPLKTTIWYMKIVPYLDRHSFPS